MTKLVSQFKAMRRAPLPLSAMMYGKTTDEAERLLMRLFPAGGPALSLAARTAFGLPPKPGSEDTIRAEILREHLEKFCIRLPRHLALPPIALPHERCVGQRAPDYFHVPHCPILAYFM